MCQVYRVCPGFPESPVYQVYQGFLVCPESPVCQVCQVYQGFPVYSGLRPAYSEYCYGEILAR